MKSPKATEELDEGRTPPGAEAFRGLLPAEGRAFLAAMERRYACKKFDGSPLPANFEDYLLEIGRLTPSSFGLEPWRFIAVRAAGEVNATLRASLSRAALGQEAVSSAGLILVILLRREGAYEPDSAFVRERSGRFPGGHPVFRADYEGYFEHLADHKLITHWARSQAYLALANMMTGAAAIGLDSCAIEGYREEEVLAALGEDPLAWMVGILGVFGRRAEAIRPKIRASLREIAEYR